MLATIGIAFSLWWLRPVLIPFVMALFIALALGMGVDLLVRHKQLLQRPVVVTAEKAIIGRPKERVRSLLS